YTGENHVVGPMMNGSIAPVTLGSSDGGVLHNPARLDGFLVNVAAKDRITFAFNFPIYSVSFDYQIFPDGTTPNGRGINPNTDLHWPDFTFQADGTAVFRTLGTLPGQGGTLPFSPLSVGS